MTRARSCSAALLIAAIAIGAGCDSVSGQSVEVGVRGSAGRYRLGAGLEVTLPHIGVFAQAAGWPRSDHRFIEAGLRAWPYGVAGHGLFVEAGWSRVRCHIADASSVATGCDDEPRNTAIIGGGFDLGFGDSPVSAFTGINAWLPGDDSPDIPDWSFRAGVRYGIR